MLITSTPSDLKYKRILLKLSGEALAGPQKVGVDPQTLSTFVREIKSLRDLGAQVALVIGGGNIHRGIAGAAKGMDRTTSDHMGMLATVINALALQDALEKVDVPTRVLTAIEIREIAELYIRRRAIRHLEKKRVVIFAAGTGRPYFTTDTTAALRANEIDADIIFKATKVDGVYDKDPVLASDAKKYDHLSYIEVLQKNLKVMDSTAISLCMDNTLNILVFNVFKEGNLIDAARGITLGTLISSQDSLAY